MSYGNYTHQAYLMVICDMKTNAIKRVAIWSSPEWEQSRRLEDAYTYIAYITNGDSFQEAMNRMFERLLKYDVDRYASIDKTDVDRYSRLLKYMKYTKDGNNYYVV